MSPLRQIEALPAYAVAELDDGGIDGPRDHGFVRRITLAYVDKDADDPLEKLTTRPVTFAGMNAPHGKNR